MNEADLKGRTDRLPPNAIYSSGAAQAARFLVVRITKQNTKYTGQLALFRYKSRWHWASACGTRIEKKTKIMMKMELLWKRIAWCFAASAMAMSSKLGATEPVFMNESMSGTESTYRILPRPLPKHVGKHLPYSTTNQPTPHADYESKATGPYAYGWFGPKSTPEWSRHFGYGRRYTQWTLK